VPAPGPRPASPPRLRASWEAVYERTPYRKLPWFSERPSPDVRLAVEQKIWRPGGTILDVGCGAGTNLIYLAQHGFRPHGIDFSPVAVRTALERAARAGVAIDAREGDALRLPFARGRFDGAIDIGCFHTLPIDRREQYREELYRVLKPDARLVLDWAARESRRGIGPPHRPAVVEVTAALERRFLFESIRYVPAPGTWKLEIYTARARRRSKPWPPAR
jgi:SAM-dependent methyltransferase